MIGLLPQSLEVNGREYPIRSDYRDILNIIAAFNDPDLEPGEKSFVCLLVLFKDYEEIPPKDYVEAYKKALWFMDMGEDPEERHSPRLMDWEQDERILFPAINSTAGFEVRSVEYLHWWTFMGYFMEIKEGTFSQVLSLRQKKAKGKKLEKWEREYWEANKKLCTLRPRLTEQEREQKERLLKMLDG